MGASTILWTLTPPCFTLRAAGYGGSFFSPVRFSIFSLASRLDHARSRSRAKSHVRDIDRSRAARPPDARSRWRVAQRPRRVARQAALESKPVRAAQRHAPPAPPQRLRARSANPVATSRHATWRRPPPVGQLYDLALATPDQGR